MGFWVVLWVLGWWFWCAAFVWVGAVGGFWIGWLRSCFCCVWMVWGFGFSGLIGWVLCWFVWICGFRFGVLLNWFGCLLFWIVGVGFWGYLFCFVGGCLGLVICLCLVWVVWVCLGFDGWLRLCLFCLVLGCCLRMCFVGGLWVWFGCVVVWLFDWVVVV